MSDIVWTSQVTHTAVKIMGELCRSATYTQAPGTLIFAIGTVFEAPGGMPSHSGPVSRVEIGNFADERVARAACEAFCQGRTLPEISEIVRAQVIAFGAMDASAKAPAS